MRSKVERVGTSDHDRDVMLKEIGRWVARRVKRHGAGAFVGPHEGLGVITEEFHELVEAVQSNDRRRVRAEAIDVAVAGYWLALSIDVND